jgi:hypothetical protein
MSIGCRDKHERDRWVRLLRETKMAAKQRTNPSHKSKKLDEQSAEEHETDKYEAPWIPDQHATKCLMETCTTEFNLIRRRHHCRVCGYVSLFASHMQSWEKISSPDSNSFAAASSVVFC